MQKRRFRLRRTQDFERLRREGQVSRHSMVMVSFAPNDLSHNRYGFVTAKRLGKAVVRNRVRRRLRESIQLLHPQLKPGYDIVLIARPGIIEQPFKVIHRTVIQLCRQVGLVIEEP